MTIDDMTQSEKYALVGLARMMVRADRAFSREEASALDEMAAQFGADAFWQIADETRALDDAAIKAHVADVSRRAVQEEIYGALYQLAMAGTVTEGESDILDWLSALWKIAARVDPYRG